MTGEEYMEIHTKAWEEFQSAYDALEKKFEARVSALVKKRQKIVDAAIAELQKTDPPPNTFRSKAVPTPALTGEALHGST